MKTQIIEFKAARYEEVIDLIRSVLNFIGLNPEKYPDLTRDISLENILSTYKGRSRFWIALVDGGVIGTVAIEEKDSEVAKLKRMFVIPEYHGKGVAQELMDTALAFAIANGYKTISLNTDRVMHRAHRFYERNGFWRTGEDTNRFFYVRSLE
jgi:GNAT superfamily N-acetyltransferase